MKFGMIRAEKKQFDTMELELLEEDDSYALMLWIQGQARIDRNCNIGYSNNSCNLV
jgi:hypothetical protein